MNPKFSEGEIVVLQSSTHPQFNGEYPVQAVYKFNKEDKTIFHPGIGKLLVFKNLTTDFVYDLGNLLDAKYCTLNDEFELKKKHNPSSMSYQELMTNLSTKIQERI